MTFSITSLSYRQLQQVLDRPENTVKRNAKGDVLRAECQRLINIGVLSTEYLSSLPAPEPSGEPSTTALKTRTKFDWQGFATDRKHAVKLLKDARALGHTTVKLNASNVALLDALREYIDKPLTFDMYLAKRDKLTKPTKPTEPVKARSITRAATITAIPTLTIPVPEVDQLEYERAECARLLRDRTLLQMQLCLRPHDRHVAELLDECKGLLHEMPARAFC